MNFAGAWGARRGIALRAGIAALVVITVVAMRRGEFFALPRSRPLPFVAIAVLYPIVSVLPQELLYRSFFFHRYGGLLKGRAVLLASALAFSFLHVIYADPLAPLLALPAGLSLGRTYERSGSLLAAAVEHALFGLAVFTFGLHRAFLVAAS